MISGKSKPHTGEAQTVKKANKTKRKGKDFFIIHPENR